MPKFTLNDERVQNSYGFKIKTEGISLTRFEKNPVMLDGHQNSNLSVIGKWTNIKKEKGLLTAETEFDTEDINAQYIAGKVERGLIKGASMGISFNKSDMKIIDGNLVLTACDLYEASIVAIPSNANALRLTMDGKEVSATDSETFIAQLGLSLSVEEHKENYSKNYNTMKLQLSQSAFIALGLGATTTEARAEEINTAVLALSEAKKDLEAKLKLSEEKVNAFLQKEKEAKEQMIKTMLDNAISQGKITQDKRQTFADLAAQNFDLAKSTLDSLPAKQNFGAGVKTPAGTSAVATMEDFQKLSLDEQLAFKAGNPDAYKELLKTL